MITMIETVTYLDGRSETATKDFSTKSAWIKAMSKAPVDGRVIYELKKYRETFIDFKDARIHIKVMDSDAADPALATLRGQDGLGDR